jgi:hypothetical protein
LNHSNGCKQKKATSYSENVNDINHSWNMPSRQDLSQSFVDKNEDAIIADTITGNLSDFKPGGHENMNRLKTFIGQEFDNAITENEATLRKLTGKVLKEADGLRKYMGELKRKKARIISKINSDAVKYADEIEAGLTRWHQG